MGLPVDKAEIDRVLAVPIEMLCSPRYARLEDSYSPNSHGSSSNGPPRGDKANKAKDEDEDAWSGFTCKLSAAETQLQLGAKEGRPSSGHTRAVDDIEVVEAPWVGCHVDARLLRAKHAYWPPLELHRSPARRCQPSLLQQLSFSCRTKVVAVASLVVKAAGQTQLSCVPSAASLAQQQHRGPRWAVESEHCKVATAAPTRARCQRTAIVVASSTQRQPGRPDTIRRLTADCGRRVLSLGWCRRRPGRRRRTEPRRGQQLQPTQGWVGEVFQPPPRQSGHASGSSSRSSSRSGSSSSGDAAAHTAAFAPATADTSPLEASQRSALSRRRSGLWRQRSHRARPHSGRDRAARRTAARTVHLYPANNRGGAAGRRVVIRTTWPRRRRKSTAARMTPGRRWAQNDVVRSEVGTNCAAGLAALRAARGGRSDARSGVVRPQDSYKTSCGWCG